MLVLNKIIRNLGMKSLPEKSFTEAEADRMLSLASYIAVTGGPLSNSETWLDDRGMTGIPGSTISDMLPRLSQDKVAGFLQMWMDRKCQKQTLCYDITSVSSYSRHNEDVEYGYNRDREKLAQTNLALLSSKGSGVPVWFTPLSGSMNDSRTLKEMVPKLKEMNISCLPS
jgi:hypothetical protein